MILTLVTFLLVLSVLVLAHELGHFLLARKGGIRVEEFGLGYPPRLYGKKIGETIYSLNAIPFGGFVRLYGEELTEAEETEKVQAAFWSKSKKVRTAVIVAGVLANLLLAVFCFSLVYSFTGIPQETNQVKIMAVISDSPADKAGLKEGDIVLAVEGEKVKDLKGFLELIEQKKGLAVELLLDRQGDDLAVQLMPRLSPPEGEGPLGVIVSNIDLVKYPFWQMPFRGAIEGIKEAISWGGLILFSLKTMIFDWISQGRPPRDIAGPVGILQITSGVSRGGLLPILQFTGILSVNLAILNILPLPALDGGRLLFIIYEVITRRRPKPAIERWVNTAGMLFLILLLILVTINDIRRILETSGLLSRLGEILPF